MTKPDQNSRDPRRDEVIAGEYVLGVLSAEDRIKVEARLQNDRAFAAMVNRWEENLSAINHELETMPPPPRLYPALEQRLFDASAPGKGAHGGFWTSLAFWRSATAAALAACATLLVLGPEIFSEAAPPQEMIAELSGTDSPISLMAHYNAAKGMLTITPAAARQDSAKSLELWLVEDGKAPVSLGVLSQAGDGTLAVPERMRSKMTDGGVLAISLEPLGGSPTGAATGPMIASGRARSF